MVDTEILTNSTYFFQNIVDGLSRGAVYAVFALGFTLIFGVLDIVNLAHAATYMWCAFIGWIVMAQMGLPLYIGLPVAMLAGGLIAVGLEFVAFRPLRKEGADRLAPMISSIGASIIMVSVAEAIFTVQTKRFPSGVLDPKPLFIGGNNGVRISWAQLLIIVVSILLMAGLGYLIRRTRTGKAIRAVAYSQKTARLLGINVNRVVVITFFVGGVLAGAAGILIGLLTNNIAPGMGSDVELRGLAVVILGGLGNIEGAVVGGFVLGLVETFTIAYLQKGSDYKDAVAFVILFLILLIRPNGLFGRKEVSRA
ncbi:MAG TPA: branched-chain amino acid ABC transporter permease [Chloroflexia bacterium]|nr:branched-chain amino acid ABC transporter permease [Chloroflexia bacterium]